MQNSTIHIKAKTSWYDIDLKELIKYKDLIWLFFKRNYTTRYKQTILGPLWLLLNPLITVLLYALIFGRIAGLSSDGVPTFIFYLCSNSIWTFFSTSLTQTASTFTANADIMGKVYFPRLVMPVSAVLSGMLDFLIQLGMLVAVMIGYFIAGVRFNLGLKILLVPLIILQIGILGLGFGIIVASLTTKYRDLVILVGFGVQLWMYASPVVYSSSIIPDKYFTFYMLNPLAPIMECWRSALIGSGTFYTKYWIMSWGVTLIVFVLGILVFNKVEKTFMDTV